MLDSFCVLLTLFFLAPVISPVSAKGLTTNPPLTLDISENYSSPGINSPNITSDEVSAITAALASLASLYDSSWKPAILSLVVNNSHSLDGTWVFGIGIGLYPSVSDTGTPQYAYKAYIDASSNCFCVKDLAVNDSVLKKFTTLNLSLYLRFGLSGFFINDKFIVNELFNATDSYIQRLRQVTPQLVRIASTQLSGKSFGNLEVSVLDRNVVHVSTYLLSGGLAYSEYLGTSVFSATTSTETGVRPVAMTTIVSGALLTLGVLVAGVIIVMNRKQE